MLSDKNILFIAPSFFGYEIDILKELRTRYANVDYIADRPFKSVLLKALTRIKRRWVVPFLDKYYQNKISSFNRDYDFIFVIIGEGLSENLLSGLKERYPSAVLILYMWDSFDNKDSLKRNIKFFDRCFSFDRVDAKKYGFRYRPLFYGNGFKLSEANNCDTTLSFIGTAHSDRYTLVSQTMSLLPKEVVTFCYFFIQAPWVFYFRRVFSNVYNGTKKSDFNFVPMMKKDVQDIFDSSIAIFDIEHPKQKGMTMRSIEALGSGKKLVTTNKSALQEDFYNPINIYVLDRNCAEKIPLEFFAREYQPVSDTIYYKYSISGWIDEIFHS